MQIIAFDFKVWHINISVNFRLLLEIDPIPEKILSSVIDFDSVCQILRVAKRRVVREQ